MGTRDVPPLCKVVHNVTRRIDMRGWIGFAKGQPVGWLSRFSESTFTRGFRCHEEGVCVVSEWLAEEATTHALRHGVAIQVVVHTHRTQFL